MLLSTYIYAWLGPTHSQLSDLMSTFSVRYDTRFKKILQDSHPIKGPDGKWIRKPLAYRESNIFNLCIICPPEICVNLVSTLLLAIKQSVGNLFH